MTAGADRWWLRAGCILLAIATFLALVWSVSRVVQRIDRPVYRLPELALVVAVVAAVVAATGAIGVATLPRRGLALQATFTVGLFVLATLALFSIGVLSLPFAVVALVFLVRRASEVGRAALTPLACGTALALGLRAVVVIASQPPVVSCQSGGGVRTNARYWWGGGPS